MEAGDDDVNYWTAYSWRSPDSLVLWCWPIMGRDVYQMLLQLRSDREAIYRWVGMAESLR